MHVWDTRTHNWAKKPPWRSGDEEIFEELCNSIQHSIQQARKVHAAFSTSWKGLVIPGQDSGPIRLKARDDRRFRVIRFWTGCSVCPVRQPLPRSANSTAQ